MWGGLPSWASSALRGAHTQYGYVQALYRGQVIQVGYGRGMVPYAPGAPTTATYPATSVYPSLTTFPSGTSAGWGPLGSALPVPDATWLPLDDGSIQVTGGGAPAVRRTLSVTLVATPGLFDQLSVPGVELLAYSVIAAPNGASVTIPQGVFPIDVTKMGYAANGNIQITAPDRWSRVQNARFLIPRASWNGATARQQIANLVMEVTPVGSTYTDVATSTAKVPAQTWDRDRDKAAADVSSAASIDAYFDRFGQLMIRDAPVLTYSPVWTVDARSGGVLMDATRQRDRQKTYNMVVVNPTTANGAPLFDPVFVWDDDPNSPTWAGPDPVHHPELAPDGVRPTFFSSPLVTDTGQAVAAGLTVLQRVTALESQLSLTTAPLPMLEDGDTIQVVLPPESWGAQPVTELHLIDSLTIPLRPDKSSGGMSISTRSTRPDTVQES